MKNEISHTSIEHVVFRARAHTRIQIISLILNVAADGRVQNTLPAAQVFFAAKIHAKMRACIENY